MYVRGTKKKTNNEYKNSIDFARYLCVRGEKNILINVYETWKKECFTILLKLNVEHVLTAK